MSSINQHAFQPLVQKNPKNPIKPKKPSGLGFFLKTGFSECWLKIDKMPQSKISSNANWY